MILHKLHALPLVIALWAVGCGSAPSSVISDAYVVSIDASFSETDRVTILDAISRWQWQTPVAISWSDRCPEVDGRACFHNSNLAEIRAHGGVDSDIGLTLEGSGDIYLDTAWLEKTNFVGKSAMHEFGHAMGLHHNGPGNAMSAYVQKMASDVTCDDAAQWYEIRERTAPPCTPR